MKQFAQNEEAVSPVIGVILMVAITVILAAVIAAFVFGMTGNVQSTKNVAVTTSINNDQHVVMTFQGGADAASVKNLTMTINSEPNAGCVIESPKVGASKGSNNTITAGSAHVVIVANFNDGSSQVVLDKNY
jgi:flagellin-like protein